MEANPLPVHYRFLIRPFASGPGSILRVSRLVPRHIAYNMRGEAPKGAIFDAVMGGLIFELCCGIDSENKLKKKNTKTEDLNDPYYNAFLNNLFKRIL